MLLPGARQLCSPNYDDRPDNRDISLLVIHNISLPPGEFGGPWIDLFFTNNLPSDAHPYFEQIASIKVSSHLLIRRDGELVQYVPLDKRAWHAGLSSHDGRDRCNDFSIGIELEGTDESAYTDEQYQQLAKVTKTILVHYPKITHERIVGHNDIAPGRKTDPGLSFDWTRYRALIT